MHSAWHKLLCTDRFKVIGTDIQPVISTSHSQGTRSEFHVDYDRVVFSGAFRKLGRKTQVHPLAKNDQTHNRLTHSVEVASVGRSLGNQVGDWLYQQGYLPNGFSPSDIGTLVQVACLAHDLGNPPFGHTGERVLRDWWLSKQPYLAELSDDERADICTYEGNAHSLRIVATLEMYTSAGGMRLTAASLGTLMKYPWGSNHSCSHDKGGKFNIYQSEMPLIRHVAHALALPSKGGDHWARHPLSYLMEAADDICYALLDLEDAVELDLINTDELEYALSGLFSEQKLTELRDIKNPTQRRAAMRGKAISVVIDAVYRAFIDHHDALLTGDFAQKDLIDACDPCIKKSIQDAKALARDKVFRHPSKLNTEIAAFGCLGFLMDLLMPAVHARKTGNFSKKDELVYQLLKDAPISDDDSPYHAYMKVLDFVGGLTDNSAAKLARELSGVGLL